MRENKPTRWRMPLPKEHGSWAMFAVPLIIGLAVAAQWQWRSILLIAAALGLFLVRFPIDTLIKTRKRPIADRARLIRWAVAYGSIATICGGWLILIDRLYALIGMGLIGAALLILGSAPLALIVAAAAVVLWPDPNPNPIGPGLLFFFTFWPAVICILIGVVRVYRANRAA